MKLQSLVLTAAIALTMTTAFAVPVGTWAVAAGTHYVDPKNDNGNVTIGGTNYAIDVDGDVRPTISGEYFIADNIGVELLAAIPFHHDLTLTDARYMDIKTNATLNGTNIGKIDISPGFTALYLLNSSNLEEL